MINVLEHVLNAPVILRAIYNALKPGGILVFNDRWWDDEPLRPLNTFPSWAGVDALFHPVRLRKAVIEAFLSGFKPLYDVRDDAATSFKL